MHQKIKKTLNISIIVGIAITINLLIFHFISTLNIVDWKIANFIALTVSVAFVMLIGYRNSVDNEISLLVKNIDGLLVLFAGLLLDYILLFLSTNIFYYHHLFSKLISDLIVVIFDYAILKIVFCEKIGGALL